MDFEEFFKRKRIDLDALQKVEPALFSEFKTHFGLMGEKSFDHTKKYWFNKLRLQFPAPAEVKTEKVKIDNPLAEQTITESLIEETATPPKLGFVPKFKANIPKPAATDTTAEVKPEEQLAATPAPKLGFTPKFKAASPPKPAAEQAEPAKTEESPAPAPKLGFTPKFKAANLPKPVIEPEKPADSEAPKETPPAESTEAKPAYKPRFNPKNIPKKEE